MKHERRPVVAVVGSARVDDEDRRAQLRDLGAALMAGGFRLVTGGLGGTMEAVSLGARSSEDWREGMILGVVPSYRHDEANQYCDVVIPSGLQVGRNLLVVSTADVVVAVGGGAGTLSEIALAWQLKRPIIALGDDGWAGRVAGQRLDQRSPDPVHRVGTVAEVIEACLRLWPLAARATDIRAH